MKKLDTEMFIKKIKKGIYKDKEFANYGEDNFTHTQGLYVQNVKGHFYAFVTIAFKTQKELQDNVLIKITNTAGSKILK